MKPVAVVDGANVALEERNSDGKAKVASLLKMQQLLEQRGYRPILVTDANLRYKVDDERLYDQLDRSGVIHQVPAGTEADYFVLEIAERENAAVIISNDRYQDYRDRFPWVNEKRLPFMVVDGDIILYCPEAGEGRHNARPQPRA